MIIKHLKYYLNKFDHFLLLGSLLFWVATPIWEQVVNSTWIWVDLAIISIILSGLSVTYSQGRKTNDLGFYFGVLTLSLSVLQMVIDHIELLDRVVQYSQIGFFLLLSVVLFGLIIRAVRVDAEVLVNAVSGYLLLGICWAIVIAVWTNADPDSFNFGMRGRVRFYDEVYYSFITLTTLGYGDMLPVSDAAKSFSVLISITGAFYTTIILGMIVGKYISNETLKKIKD